jgi:hypothetical protein
MSLPWVRLETAFPTNPKTLALVEDRAWQAIAAYICGLSYCGAQGTAGFIPRAALPFLHARPTDARKLVEVGLWTECAGGWDINGWLDFQPTSEEIQKRKDRAKKAAAARWSAREVSAIAKGLNDA